MARLRITQVKSGLGSPKKIRSTLLALGVRHQRTVVKPDHPAIRGMIFHVRHLVRVERLGNGEAAGGTGAAARRGRGAEREP